MRYDLYVRRRKSMICVLEAEVLKLENQVRFIMEKIENRFIIEKTKSEMIKTLQDGGYVSDPIKAWKKSQQIYEEEGDSDSKDDSDASTSDYNYLLEMSLWNLTHEKKDDLLQKMKVKTEELNKI